MQVLLGMPAGRAYPASLMIWIQHEPRFTVAGPRSGRITDDGRIMGRIHRDRGHDGPDRLTTTGTVTDSWPLRFALES